MELGGSILILLPLQMDIATWYIWPDLYLCQCIYYTAGIFCGAKFLHNYNLFYYVYFSQVKFSRKQISIIDIHKVAIVCTRDVRNSDVCQVVQYYGYGRTH